jgi:hypothetical protein
VTQAAGGVGVRPGMSLPIRVHDLLLDLAGRIDDDALADVRELLASAEVDRSLEFLVGCLVAGRIAITNAQRDELASLFTQVYLDPVALSRVVVDDAAADLRHRFGSGSHDGESAGHGVAEAAKRVLDVLPDVRSVWAVWRLTPAGAVSGPVPHRVVLVGVGPAGFAPATAYRIEDALRRAGLRASVEVLRDGIDAPDYHHAAMQFASQVPFSRQAPANPSPVRSRPSVVPTVTSKPDSPSPARRARVEQAEEPPPKPPRPSATDTAQMQPRPRPEPPADPLASAKPPPRPAPAEQPGNWISNTPERTTPRPANGTPPPPVDESLSDQEKNLLRQLQEELARREQEESVQSGVHLIEPGSRHGGQPHTFDWPNQAGTSITINGMPPDPHR